MSKESFYFSHDYNSRNDPKMMRLRMEMKMEGVGIYWCIIEMLYEEGGYLMQSECERIAFELRVDKDSIARVLDGFDLFKKDKNKFWSNSVLNRLKKRKDKSEKASNSAKIRWDDTDAMRTHTEGNAIKERKGKERKGNNTPPAELPFNSLEFKNAWDSWEVHRKEKRNGITPTSRRSQLKKLAALGEKVAIDWINFSIEKGYTGLYPPPQQKQQLTIQPPNPASRKEGTNNQHVLDEIQKQQKSA